MYEQVFSDGGVWHMSISKKVRVKNSLGLHTRPATYIVKLLQRFRSKVSFTYKRQTVNPRSILSILMLGVPKNASIGITVEGEDADDTMQELLNAFECHFGEMESYSETSRK